MDSLLFLKDASNDDLKDLCDIVIKDKKGNYRLTEELSSSKGYKLHYPDDMQAILPDLIKEFRKFWGNTLVNIFRRGEGPKYSEILRDVAKRNKVNFNKDASDERIEDYLLQKLFTDSLEKASEEELKQLIEELGLPVTNFSREALTAALIAAWRAGGFKSYMLLVSVANAVARFVLGRGLSLAFNAGLTRLASIVTGPVGWALTAVWTLADISGPAYRVTVPAVIQIAYIRRAVNARKENWGTSKLLTE